MGTLPCQYCPYAARTNDSYQLIWTLPKKVSAPAKEAMIFDPAYHSRRWKCIPAQPYSIAVFNFSPLLFQALVVDNRSHRSRLTWICGHDASWFDVVLELSRSMRYTRKVIVDDVREW